MEDKDTLVTKRTSIVAELQTIYKQQMDLSAEMQAIEARTRVKENELKTLDFKILDVDTGVLLQGYPVVYSRLPTCFEFQVGEGELEEYAAKKLFCDLVKECKVQPGDIIRPRAEYTYRGSYFYIVPPSMKMYLMPDMVDDQYFNGRGYLEPSYIELGVKAGFKYEDVRNAYYNISFDEYHFQVPAPARTRLPREVTPNSDDEMYSDDEPDFP